MNIEISAVIPIYNEDKTIGILHTRLTKALNKITPNYEVIYVDDGSTDKSLNLLEKIRNTNKKVKIISFSRNFGHMAAVEAGLSYSKGKYVVLLDGDLQDPPELIIQLYKKIKKGYFVVYGVKQKRKEKFIRKFLLENFYKLLNFVSDYKMPPNAGTFSIMRKEIVEILISMPEKNKYFSGLRSWAGYKQSEVVYERDARYAGKPASFRRLIRLALDGIFSFSYMPLRIASLMGFILAFVSFVFILIVIGARLFLHAGILGWASTLSAILLIGGVQLITLGIIGEYLARIYDEVKGRPKYLIKLKAGIR